MKTKKRLLSFLSCMLILATSVTGVFADERPTVELSPETDGVAKHYELIASNREGSTFVNGTENDYYQIVAHSFCDVGDTSTVKFTDYSDNMYTSSEVFTRFEIEAEDVSDVEGAIAEGWITHADNGIYLSYSFKEESVRGTDFTSQTYSYLFKINDKTYVLDENNELVESTTPKGCYLAYDDETETTSKSGSCFIKLNNYNTIVGTTLKTEATKSTDGIKLEDAQLSKVSYEVYKNNTKVETLNLENVLNNRISTPIEPTYTVSFKLNADGSVTVDTDQTIMGYFHDSTDLVNIYAACTTNADGTKTIAASTIESLDTIVIYYIGYNNHLYHISIDVKDVPAILQYTETLKNSVEQQEMKTVTITPTITVTDMPADGTMKEGFDITFKSNAPVVLSTQEAPDVSVCSITNKQADGSYTGVYHVDAIGNKDVKFNVNPTVASELSEDGLTKTVYNSTVYTLSIKAFDPSVSTPNIDDEDTVPDDDVIIEIPEETDPVDPSDPNGPDKIPQTGDSTPIIPLMITMLVSLTVVIFCIVHRKKAKTLLSVLLVAATLGGTLTGIQMNPTTAYAAAPNGSDGSSVTLKDGKAADGAAALNGRNGNIYYFITIATKTQVDSYIAQGCKLGNGLLDNMLYFNCMVGNRNPGYAYSAATIAKEKGGWGISKAGAEGTKWKTSLSEKGARVFCENSNYYIKPGQIKYITLNTLCDIVGFNKSSLSPSGCGDSCTSMNYFACVASSATGTSIADVFNTVANETSITKKVQIAKALFDDNQHLLTEDYLKDKMIICIPYLLTYNRWGSEDRAQTYLTPYGYYYYSGQTIPKNAQPYGSDSNIKTLSNAIQNKCFINTYWGGIVNNNVSNYKYKGVGTMFTTKASDPVITYDRRPYSDIAYSSYINFALDSKNTTVKYTNDYTNYGGYSGWNFANSDSYITFKHDYRIDKTFTDGALTSTNYVDLGYTKSGSLNIASGTKVTGNSVFNGQGYAVSSVPSCAGVYAYPYISYKWVKSASGGIGNVWSLDIGTHPGVAYGTTNYFLSVANYKSYAGTIPTLDTIKSYLSKNANESGVNRFSNSGYVKFRADFSSPTMYNFLSIDNSVKTSLASQNEDRDSVIFTATYTPVSITSNIKLVEVVQDGSTLKVKSVTDGASTSYANTTTGSLTTPTGYKFYKAVAAGGTGVKVGDVVTSTGLTACNKTTLKVGSSAIDKGYTIYCYKLPDTWKTDSNVATYVGEDYVNNVDFTYTSYVSGSWKYNGAPTVTGYLTGINSAWTTKTNTILGGTLPGVSTDTVNRLAHQRTFMINANRASYQTLNLSPFVSNSAANANKNGLAGVSAQQSTNKVNTTMDSGAAAYYNNYYTVSGRKVFQPLSSLTNQVNTWKGTTDSFTVNDFTFNKAEVTYKNTTYVGVYNAPSIGTQAVTNNALTNNGKVYTEVANTGTKLEFVPHYNMKVVAFGDGSDPHAYSSRYYYNVSVMSNFKRSFNSAMLSGYTFTTGTVSGTTSSDYVDNNGDTLKGSDVTLKVSNPTLSLNTFAYVVDIYGDGDANEKINGYNPASQWGINKYSELLGKVNTKFSNYLTTVQNNLEYSVVLDNEGTKYKDFTVSTSKANPSTSVTTDTNTYVLTIKNGVIVNDTAYQAMIASIKADFGLASTTEAETLFNNSGIKNMIVNSMHTSVASNNTSTGKWYDEQVNTICIRRFAKTGIQLITNAVVQDKIDYNSEKGDGEWTFIVKNGSATILETEINGAEFEISDKTTQN